MSPAIGWLDGVVLVSSQQELILISGWALTSDYPLSALGVRITIDGQLYPMPSPGYVLADRYRPDVGAAYPGYGDYHGFYHWVPAPVGIHTVCAQAQNSGVYNYLTQCVVYNMPPLTTGFGPPYPWFADAMPHTYTSTEGTVAEKLSMLSIFNDRMINQYDARTDIITQPVSYTSSTDVYWFVDPAVGTADTLCMNLISSNICNRFRIRFNTTWAANQTIDQKRQGACHEIGHTVGFDDSVPQIALGCMSGGGLGILSTNEIWDINAGY
ncbi:MAG: hypothetical protein AAB131_11360 [Actinomycetota bacterium]